MIGRGGLALLFSLLAAVSTASGESYPDRPIRLISPNPAGGANDTIVRIIAAKMSTLLGATIVVDNRGGAGGKIGAEAVARAPADGYTLLAGSVGTHSFAPVLTAQLAYDPIKDFEPISLFALVQNLLVVNPKLAAHSVAELVALAKASPGKLNYASGGPGSTSHFAVAMFVSLAGIRDITVHVPFRGGSPAMTATIAGDTQFFFSPIAGMVPFVELRRGAGAGGERRDTLAGLAERADHRGGRHAAISRGRLVRPDGASGHARRHRQQAERRGRAGVKASRGDRGVARPGHRARRQPAAGVRGLHPRPARAAPGARQGRRPQDQRVGARTCRSNEPRL